VLVDSKSDPLKFCFENIKEFHVQDVASMVCFPVLGFGIWLNITLHRKLCGKANWYDANSVCLVKDLVFSV
jgi:hypothetical protein